MTTFPFNDVEGLLADQDKEDLRRMAVLCNGVPGDYVEVGSMHGLSTCCICSGMSPDKRLRSYDVNHPTNQIAKNLTAAGFGNQVVLITGDFVETMSGSVPTPVGFAFIDHDHRLTTTVFAYGYLWPKLSKGGIMAFHDYRHPDYPEPTPFFDMLPHRRVLETGIIAFIKE